MTDPHPTATALFDEIGALVRAILRRKSGLSLEAGDARAENVDAIELAQEVMLRVWERVADDGGRAGDITDLRAYAATVAHNAWSDHLRRQYPRRASLKNRVRYFITHQPRYATWPGADGDLLAGLHGWRLSPPGPVPASRVQALCSGQERLASGSVPRKDLDQFVADDWDRLLSALFARTQAPVVLDDLVAICCALLGLREDRVDSLDETDEEGSAKHRLADDEQRQPEAAAELASAVREVWNAVRALKPDYRAAYLLNLPGPGKSRADIEVFVLQGAATLADIESALALSTAQYEQAFALLDAAAAEPDPGERFERERCATDLERFCLLWRHLPLADQVIARLLGLEPQQVINRRMLALRELARLLGHAQRRGAARAGGSAGGNR